eukprot:1144463-Pelagomonas_calceolata.AAC.3
MFDASFGATETLQPKFVHPLPWQLLHINQIPRACAEHLGNVQARGSLLARGGLVLFDYLSGRETNASGQEQQDLVIEACAF